MPYNVSVAMVMTNDVAGLSVTWENDPACYGTIEGHVMSDQNVMCNSTSTSCTLTPVGCGEVHTIQVTSSNEAGPGSPSAPTVFTTCEC